MEREQGQARSVRVMYFSRVEFLETSITTTTTTNSIARDGLGNEENMQTDLNKWKNE